MLLSTLGHSLIQILADCSHKTHPRIRRLKRQQRSCGTEQLEVRQLLTGDFESALRFGSAGLDEGKAITTDAGGNIYTTGTFSGTVDFDPGTGVWNLVSQGSTDIFVTKSDSSGNLIWARRMGGDWDDSGEGIAVDRLGNVYTTGYFLGTADFDPGAGTANRISVGERDIFVSKLDASGNYLWGSSMGGVFDDSGYDIAVDSSGSVCTTGTFMATADFDPGFGVANRTSPGVHGVFVSKLAATGGFLWAASIGGAGDNGAFGIAVDRSNNVYTAGHFMGSPDFDPGAGDATLTSAGESDIFVSKLSSDGTLVWARNIGGVGFDKGSDIAVDRAGNVSIVGVFSGPVDFDPHADIYVRHSVGLNDVFIVQLDGDGRFVWAHSLGSTLNDSVVGIAVDGSGNVYVTGCFYDEIDFDPGAGKAIRRSSGERDMFVLKLDGSGNYGWCRTLGTVSDDFVSDIAVDVGGGVHAIGSFSGTVDFDSGIAVANLNSAGGSDVFVLKLSPDMLHTLTDGLTGELLLRRNGTMLELWFKGSFTFGQYVLFDTHPVSAIRSVRLKGSNAGNVTLTLDFASGGSFAVDQGIHYTAGTGAGDSVQLIGAGNEGFTYRPSSAAGSGKFAAYGREISFTGVEYTAVTTAQALSIEPSGSADVLTVGSPISLGGPITSDITGTTGGGAIVPLLFTNVRDLTIDTGFSDAALAQSNDTVTFNAGSYETPGLKNVFVRTGKGNDTLRVNSADLGLPESGGSFWFLGGSGSDLLQTTGDANWDLNETRLVSSGGGRLQFDEAERVSITGGASNNHLNAAMFTGAVILDGAAGNDLLRGGAGSDTIFGGIGNDRLYGGLGDDVLHGQDGNDSVWGDDGLDILNGNAGNDLLWGGNDDDFLSGHTGNDVIMGGSGRDTLNGGELNDRLYGEAGDDVILGGTGLDQLWGGDDDDFLSGEEGDDELWGGNGNDQLDGGSGADLILGEAGRDFLNGGSDMDLLDGGSGNDRLNGDGGIDLYILQGTENTEELWLNFVSANSALFRRRPRGLVSTLELDTITMDASDEFQILALGGDDNLLVDALFTQLGQLDGGAGDDLSGAPAGWTKISC
jgi:hypothetical protein